MHASMCGRPAPAGRPKETRKNQPACQQVWSCLHAEFLVPTHPRTRTHTPCPNGGTHFLPVPCCPSRLSCPLPFPHLVYFRAQALAPPRPRFYLFFPMPCFSPGASAVASSPITHLHLTTNLLQPPGVLPAPPSCSFESLPANHHRVLLSHPTNERMVPSIGFRRGRAPPPLGCAPTNPPAASLPPPHLPFEAGCGGGLMNPGPCLTTSSLNRLRTDVV